MGNITVIMSSLHERGDFINTKELCKNMHDKADKHWSH